MNHEDTKTQSVHEDYFVLLRDFVPYWFKIQIKGGLTFVILAVI